MQQNAFSIRSILGQPITCSVIILSVMAYGLLLTRGLSGVALWFMPDTVTGLWQPHSFWRLLSPIFIHYTFFHLATNLYLWWLFAARIERRSSAELLFVLLLAALASNIAEWWWGGPNFGGLSGVVFALLGYCWSLSKYGGVAEYSTPQTLNVVLIILLLISTTGFFGHYANIAHIVGLVTGALLALLSVKIRASWRW